MGEHEAKKVMETSFNMKVSLKTKHYPQQNSQLQILLIANDNLYLCWPMFYFISFLH